jgi:hypothetical protein
MRAPILRWKASLALLAVVVIGVSLGSALHTTRPIGWTSYTPGTSVHTATVVLVPGNAKMTRQMRRKRCVGLRAMISEMPKSVRRENKSILSVCGKHR